MPPKQSEPDGNSAPSSPLSPAASNTPLNGVHNGSPSAVQIDYQIGSPGKPMIDPELADLPPPPHHHMPEDDALPVLTREPGQMSITESIAQAPNPKPADFSMLPITNEDMDLTTLDPSAMDGPPGSPSARLLKAIAPPNAAQPDSKWQPVSRHHLLHLTPDGRAMDGCHEQVWLFLSLSNLYKGRRWWQCLQRRHVSK